MATATRYKWPAPTCSEINSSVVISNDEAEQIVSEYIDSTAVRDTVVNQLIRLQRSLRGLPSIIQAPQGFEGGVESVEQYDQVPTYDEEYDDDIPKYETKVSKDERKRLKKERRKKEKKQKVESAKAAKDDEEEEDRMSE